jgi:hypothetical protein
MNRESRALVRSLRRATGVAPARVASADSPPDHAAVGFAVLQLEPWTYVHISRAYRDILGLGCDDPAPGVEGWVAMVDPADRDVARSMVRRMAGGQAVREQVRIRCRDGGRRTVCTNAWPVVGGDGSVKRAAMMVERVGDPEPTMLLGDAASAASEWTSTGLVADLAGHPAPLADGASGGCSTDLVHEFNNVLSIILNYCALLQTNVVDPVAAGDLEQIRRAAERATALTKRLPGAP